MKLVAKKPIIVHPDDAVGALFGRVVKPGESFECSSEAAAQILLRDGEAETPERATARAQSDATNAAIDDTAGGEGGDEAEA